MYKIEELQSFLLAELKAIAKKLQIEDYENQEKQVLIYKILDQQAITPEKLSSKKPVAKKTLKKKPATPKKTTKATESKEKSPKESKKNTVSKEKDNSKTEGATEEVPPAKKVDLQIFAGLIDGEGIVDVMPEGYGFLRSSDYNYLSSPDDIYVAHQLVKQWGLKRGDTVTGKIRPPKEGEKYFGLTQITAVNGKSLEEIRGRKDFQYLTSLFPEEQLTLTDAPNRYAMRIIDLFAPIGKGQRAMIVAPPKAGKTILLKEIANGISKNHPEVYLIVLLIDERPEEVTDMRRSVKGEVIASTFDEQPENHIRVANNTLKKAKRLVEVGHDVVILLDSVTRLARAENTCAPSSGKIMSGGVVAEALLKPKRFLGAARNVENGGSLTIIASALVETGSKMDEVIFEEFKGTGNMELQLSRSLANRSIYPAIDINKSSTRRGENMQNQEQVRHTRMLRRIMGNMNVEESIEFLLENMKKTQTNEEFLASIHS